ncbi:hypothetical protein [Psychroserpens algicola]|uniref:Uncharacterized protein n=1 Tax=Psychroserpens algicola TaxID=1719034 RepID=A0ABT0HD21_9FLAO|nr:hypothetical protein [Psychroserpens algicola]MCK8481929.1 hypothetical protein [Psychroserpens algicola]
MTRIVLLGLSLMIIVLNFGCSSGNNDIEFGDLMEVNEKIQEHYFSDYCKDFENLDMDRHEIISSFVGDYGLATKLFSERNDAYEPHLKFENNQVDMTGIKDFLQKKIESHQVNDLERIVSERTLEVINRTDDLEKLFQSYSIKDAKTFIANKAKNYHFTTINESHHSGQNRAFTRDLLQPMWDNGYRYLALEAFSQRDSLMCDLKYPTFETGFYFRDSNLGNLVREALSIGYTLIQYDVSTNQNLNLDERENLRDISQANNIYRKTLKKDAIGKVLIHSGFDHQLEFSLSDDREAMGAALKRISGKEIFTINQNVMVENSKKENDYYKQAHISFKINEPSVFINEETQSCLVDPIKYLGGIDVQVYHPKTEYKNGRPNWMVGDKSNFYKLPDDIIKQYEGHLLTVRPKDEPVNSTPVDQFIINSQRQLILPKGNFTMNIIDCNKTLVAKIPIINN